ncbi:MAG: 30S ribosomal protein S10 [Metamycoplasmataceae bacterium]
MQSLVQKNKKETTLEKINIKVKAYESALVDHAAKKIVEIIKSTKTEFRGPVPLPTKRELFTILRSVHVNKKSREQFERKTHKRLIVLENPSKDLIEKLKRAEISAGVIVEMTTINNK